MIHGAQLFHVTSAIILIGLSVISYTALLRSYYNNYMTSDATLRTVVIVESLILFPLILLTIASALLINLAGDHYFSYTWILSSCLYLSLFVICLTASIYLKIYYYFRAKMTGIYHLKPIFHLLSVIQFLLLLAIMHDMITKQTWLSTFI